MLARRIPLLANKKLLFTISYIDVPEPYSIEWKVLNRGTVSVHPPPPFPESVAL